MMRFRMPVLAGMLLLGSVAAHATWYTSEAAFVAAINPTYYLEDFSSFTFGNPLNGTQTTWAAPGANGYGWTATTTSSAPALGLYSNTSALSVNSANDGLVLNFTGSPVKAFGGIVANSDISGNLQAGTVTMTLSDATTSNITFATATSGFLGWVGPTAFTSVTITATSGVTNNWPQLDHAYTGTAAAVPEPMSMTGLAIGALALLRRRKKA
jgi:hypothetical protein